MVLTVSNFANSFLMSFNSAASVQAPAATASTPVISSPSAAAPTGPRPRRQFRGDIQAMRAFAVGCVFLNHLWPERLTGGFIGVDVFFVISGFLITTHLLSSLLDRGGLRLRDFYARRIRRLLPMAFLVLAVSAAGVAAFLPVQRWRPNFVELFFSAVYGENLYLVHQAVDYHAANQDTSIAQHYWSLSVEEQFYIVWPLALVAGVWLCRRFFPTRLRLALGLLLASGAGASLAYSVSFTASHQAQAYFFTPVRVWEFAAGGLVAVAAPALTRLLRAAVWVRLPLAGAGWIAMVAAAWIFSPHMAFPGWVALLPVGGAAAVLIAGLGGKVPLLDPLTSLAPVRWLGDVSYSVYLWHWPLIVLAPAVLDAEVRWWHKLAIGIIALILAGLSKPLVEDWGLRTGLLNKSLWRAFAFMLGGMALAAAGAWGGGRLADHLASAESRRLAEFLATDCAGPGALDPANNCPNKLGKPHSVTLGEESIYYRYPDECRREELPHQYEKFSGKLICDYRPDPQAPVDGNQVLMLLGDSHADQWSGPLIEIARARQLRFEALIVAGCPVRQLSDAEHETQTYLWGQNCADASRTVIAEVAKTKPARLVYSLYAKEEPLAPEGDQQTLYNESLGGTWRQLIADGVGEVFVIADVPYNHEVRDLNCYSQRENPAVDCRVERGKALAADPLPGTVPAAADPRVKLVDFTDAFCDAEYCYQVAGEMLVYFDQTHLNKQYALKLRPRLERALFGQ